MIRNILKALDPRYVYRSAITGRFVSRLYAVAHPDETIRERRR